MNREWNSSIEWNIRIFFHDDNVDKDTKNLFSHLTDLEDNDHWTNIENIDPTMDYIQNILHENDLLHKYKDNYHHENKWL